MTECVLSSAARKKSSAGKKFQKTLKEMTRPTDKLIEQRQEILAAQKVSATRRVSDRPAA
ncbi:hypothetical protein SELSPUOL_02375 [Selenomonas sputigena ATCC 35185]|uniref:Uncharacterized protein n=1 Tax=Selenomonas sputigena (strain ATCC 35185 / DSM 20758 / CCUG 44933 / VPI D19B-28) TaxID=546271 RepID=C9LY16_SELS3|nr:hypothetical protein SELSPUOL_02375 [Selenomonas sputigena ATCC 35185]